MGYGEKGQKDYCQAMGWVTSMVTLSVITENERSEDGLGGKIKPCHA